MKSSEESYYAAPETERPSPTLSRDERRVLESLLEYREPFAWHRPISSSVMTSLFCTPFAIAFTVLFVGVAFVFTGLSFAGLCASGFAAFATAMMGFFLRDLADHYSSRQLWEVQNRITDFNEIERLMYGHLKAADNRSDPHEPLAAIPVEEDRMAGSMVEAKR